MERANKPNFVFFIADQLRADALGHLNPQGAATPNIEKLAGDGVSFRNAYCQNPVCVPSRCSMLTGWYPHTKGHRTMHFLLDEDDPTMLEQLKMNGYEVIWAGKDEVIPLNRDFSKYCDRYYPGAYPWDREKSKAFEKQFRGEPSGDNFYSFYAGKVSPEQMDDNDRSCLDYSIQYLRERREAGREDKPFCLFLCLSNPHPPYGCSPPWYGRTDRSHIPARRPTPENWEGMPSMLKAIYEKQGLQGWSEERFAELKGTYYDMISQLDERLGELVAVMKETGVYDGTALFFFSDHGDFTGDYGLVEKAQNTFYDCQCNVPLIIKPPAGTDCRPRVSGALAEQVDIPATVAELGGFSLNYTQFGRSLCPVLAGVETHRDAVFCEGGRIHGELQAMERGHGPDSLYWPRLSTQCEEGPEHTKAIMVREQRYKYVYRLYEPGQLFDLEEDPQELVNLAGRAEYGEIEGRLQARILRFLVETGDFVPNRKDKGY